MRRLRFLRVLLVGLFTSLISFSLVPAGALSADLSHAYQSSCGVLSGSLVSLAANQKLNQLQRLSKSLTGRTISTFRIVASLVVAVVALAALITMIYASVMGGIISVGRNPMAKLAVFRTLTSVMGMISLTTLLAAA